MTYLDIAIANEQIKTTNIKGKSYSEVAQRIKAFRMNHPLGSIATNIESLENGVVVMSCEVRDEKGELLGKAYAYEKEDSSFINQTSFIENCCTSATGRALGYAGYGIDTSVASAEEVQNTINNQTITQEDADNYTLKFGKYKGKTIKQVEKEDTKYIDWIIGNTQDENLLEIIRLATGRYIPTPEEVEEKCRLMNQINSMDLDHSDIHKKYEVEDIKDLSIEQLKEIANG